MFAASVRRPGPQNAAASRRFGRFFTAWIVTMFSMTDSCSNSSTPWNVRESPRRARTCDLEPVTSSPPRYTRPASGV